MKKSMNHLYLLIGITLVIGLTLGWLTSSWFQSPEANPTAMEEEHDHALVNGVWTCSMHPQVRQDEPGSCPFCGMDLIPVNEESDSEGNPNAIRMSNTAMQLAGVQTLEITTNAEKEAEVLALNGKIQSDERRLYTQTAHLEGRIEELLINFTGEYVQKGQTIAYLYSPALVTAQHELLEAQKTQTKYPELFAAARQKLKNWKLSEAQIDEILSSGKTTNRFPVLANASGYVTQNLLNAGDHVLQGTALYEVADLSQLWGMFEVYEKDLSKVHMGDPISFEVATYPGKAFEGKISFIDPMVDEKSRVTKARIEINNAEGLLKPDMFIKGELLVKTEEAEALYVPKSAVMYTGKRSLVYVKLTTEAGVAFVPREVNLGGTSGDHYEILSGLKPGEEIAVNGTFSIDAAAQLSGKMSMMNPEGDAQTSTAHDHGQMEDMSSSAINPSTTPLGEAAQTALKSLYNNYFALKEALVNDDFEIAQKAAVVLRENLGNIDMAIFTGEHHMPWMEREAVLKQALQPLGEVTDLEQLRELFLPLSEGMIALTQQFGTVGGDIYLQFCPMADNNNGANWLSREDQVLNPYFGASMLTCGEVVEKMK